MDREGFFKAAAKMFLDNAVDLLSLNPLQIFEDIAEDSKKPLAARWQRPPGASIEDKQFKEQCSGCDACMAACPVNVIMIDDLELRYPLIYPDKAPCVHCAGYPCIQACPTGALKLSVELS